MKNNNLVIGFLAHVDAGKTTLSEAVMYTAGVIRKLGRVDHKTAFLDNDSIEQDRGITVFSKGDIPAAPISERSNNNGQGKLSCSILWKIPELYRYSE